MEVSVLALKALKEIIDDKKQFHIVLERILSEYNLSSEEKKILRNIVLGSIKHFYFLRYEITKSFAQFKKDDYETYLLIISLYELRFCSKKFALYQVIDSTMRAADFMKLRLSKEEVSKKLTYLFENKTPIDDEIKKDPYAFNSLFFSIPLWIIKMWAEQYGDEVTMNLLLSTQKKPTQWLACNQALCSKDSLLIDNKFVDSSLASTALSLNYNGSCTELEEVRQGKVYVQDVSMQYMLDQLNYPFQAKALHIGGISGAILTNIASKLLAKHGTVEGMYSNEKRYRRSNYLLARSWIKNAKCYLGGLSLTKTYCSYEDYDLVIVTPPNSYLGQIQRKPDIPLTLTKEDMKTIIAKEKEYLEEASKFVLKDGILVYAVRSVNLKEGKNIIDEFLKKHEDFALVDSRQIYPYEFNSDGLYYAQIRKL